MKIACSRFLRTVLQCIAVYLSAMLIEQLREYLASLWTVIQNHLHYLHSLVRGKLSKMCPAIGSGRQSVSTIELSERRARTEEQE